MQRFNTSDLDKLEALFSTKGFTYTGKKTDEREGKPPLVTLEIAGRGSADDIHAVLRRAPFVLLQMSTKKLADGHVVRLQLMQSKIQEDDGWETGE
jgi:hypothetical protein